MFGLEKKATQFIEGRYLRAQRLIALLDSLFGHHEWELKMINGGWHLRSPRQLTQDEINSCKTGRSDSRNAPREHLEASTESPFPEILNPLINPAIAELMTRRRAKQRHPESSSSPSPSSRGQGRGRGTTARDDRGLSASGGGSGRNSNRIVIYKDDAERLNERGRNRNESKNPKASDESPFPSKSSEALRKSPSRPESPKASSKFLNPSKSDEESSESPSLLRSPKALAKFSSLSTSPKASKKFPSSSKSPKHPEADREPTVQSSAQGNITLTVEDKQLNGAKYLLVLRKLRGYNTDETGGPGRGYEVMSQGQTSTVFKVDAVVIPSIKGTKRPEKSIEIKLAVKRLKKNTPPIQFEEEYQNLNAVSHVRHPNIVTFLGAFLYEEYEGGNTISGNFLFPMAIGNLKQLLSGSINDSSLLQLSYSLWAQFEGLANALQFLHGRCHMVHRDIKPSNILIYQHADDQRLVAKLADFGLAEYIAEEPHRTRSRLSYQDVWKLGTVFAELLTYLSGGTKGVRQFRSFITVTYDQITSDTFEDIRYDENKVKSEVIEWLRRTPRHHNMGKEVAEITMRMLGTQDECPSAADVARYLVNSSSASFFDGSRFVHFSNAESIPGPSMLDKARSFVEKRVAAPIYWWPLPPIQYTCPTGSTRIEWKWCAHDLYVDLPTEVVNMYKEKCCTIVSSLPQGPLLPLSNPQSSSFVSGSSQPSSSNTVVQHRTTNNGPQPSGTRIGAITTAAAAQSSPQVQVRQLYWCVDKAWIEPSETWLCIEDPHKIAEDRILCTRLKDSYDSIRGLRGRYLSWKTCLGIKFTSFNRLYDGKEQVICMSVGLPKPPEYEYVLFQPELVHMAIASRQILAGIHDPSKVEGNNTLEMIPKKVDALLKPDKGAEGWGLHAVQGWSLWKIVFWMSAFTVLGLLFVVLWLVLVDPKDLQNAFTPGAFLAGMLCLALGIPQFLDAA